MIPLIQRETQFNKSLAALRRAGGLAARAANEVDSILGRLVLQGGATNEIGKLTKHGESRIRNCVKYDLSGGYRLVCITQDEYILFLYAGSHDDCDRWINNNRGLRFVMDKQTKRISRIQEIEAKAPLPQKAPQAIVNTDTPLLEQLDDADIDILPLKVSDIRRLSTLTCASGDEELLNAVESISEEMRDTVLSVLLALRDRELENALGLIHSYGGKCVGFDEHPELIEEAVGAEINSEDIIDLRELSEDEIIHLLKSADFEDWMLFLHPDQKEVAYSNFERPVLLRGISGSGKTSVIIHRANHLAEKYSNDKVGIFTLNEALASLIDDLLNQICPENHRSRIIVKSIHDLCREIIGHYDPQRLLLTFDERSRENLEDCWADSYNRPEQQQRLGPIINSLNETYKINPADYLRDEFVWIRSALAHGLDQGLGTSIPKREEYLDAERCPRTNRGIKFIPDWRVRILEALSFYEEWLDVGGFIDLSGLSLDAHRFVSRLKEDDSPFKYRCVLVDEAQDLGTVELSIIAALAPELPNGLFLAGDPNQQVFPKDQDMKKAGIIKLKRKYFRKNYRNTKQIIQAGTVLIDQFGQKENLDNFDSGFQVPEYSNRESAWPMVIRAENRKDEIKFIVKYINEKRKIDNLPICIVACGLQGDSDSLKKLRDDYEQAGLSISLLRKNSRISSGGVFLSATEDVKGFEFSLVLISGCSKAIIPSLSLPEQEIWRDCQKLYVAMTRARDELIFTHYGERSPFLDGIANQMISDTAGNLLSRLESG